MEAWSACPDQETGNSKGQRDLKVYGSNQIEAPRSEESKSMKSIRSQCK